MSGSLPVALIAGPCVIESETHVHYMARKIRDIAGKDFIFKASFDKANRSSGASYRGPGIDEGLRILGGLKAEGYRITTDIHEPWQAERAAAVCDILQIPAFLCRQTDLLVAAARTGRIVKPCRGTRVASIPVGLPIQTTCHARRRISWATASPGITWPPVPPAMIRMVRVMSHPASDGGSRSRPAGSARSPRS